jgi:hypothetical protein
MDQAELQVAPCDRACSPGWLYMSATAQGTAIYRELRESERQATEGVAGRGRARRGRSRRALA